MKFCVFLFLMCLLDAVLTHFGIVLGVIEEGNPLMRLAIEKGWSFFYLIKICLPLTLIGICCLRPFIGLVRTLLISACMVYVSILSLHIFWVALYTNQS